MAKKLKVDKPNLIFMVIIFALAIIAAAGFLYSYVFLPFPSAKLMEYKGTNSRKSAQGFILEKEMSGFSVLVPDEFGALVVGGESHPLTDGMDLYVLSLYSTESVKDGNDIVFKSNWIEQGVKDRVSETGYLNGLKIDYLGSVYKKSLGVVGFLIVTGEEYNIYIGVSVKKPSASSLNKALNLAKDCIGTIRYGLTKMSDDYDSGDELSDADKQGSRYEGFTDWEELMSYARPMRQLVTQKYYKYVAAQKDYDYMRITFQWIDISVEPWELVLYSDDMEYTYDPVSTEPGEWVYVIDNVKKGDQFKFYIYSHDLGGLQILQEDQEEWEEYYGQEHYHDAEGNMVDADGNIIESHDEDMSGKFIEEEEYLKDRDKDR